MRLQQACAEVARSGGIYSGDVCMQKDNMCKYLELYFKSDFIVTKDIYNESCADMCLKDKRMYNPDCPHYKPLGNVDKTRDVNERI